MPFLVMADDLIIELLVSSEDNNLWNPKKNMHLTLGHLKNVDGANIQKYIHLFNKNQKEFLKKLYYQALL